MHAAAWPPVLGTPLSGAAVKVLLLGAPLLGAGDSPRKSSSRCSGSAPK
jgi:hypothetical protein